MGIWNDFLTGTPVLNSSGRAGIRHAYNEAVDWKNAMDPAVGGLYAEADHVAKISAYTDTVTSGNFKIGIAFPAHSVSVETANIAYNANQSDIQTAIDTAMASVNMGTAYTAGDIDVSLAGDLTANDATLTANGDGVAGKYMEVTTTNVDLDADELGAIVDVTLGTGDRPVEQILTQYNVIVPASGVPAAQGPAVPLGHYTKGDNPKSFSPFLVQALVIALREESPLIGAAVDDLLLVDGQISSL